MSSAHSLTQTKILLVEDDETDVVHFQRLCRKHGLEADVELASSGDDALAMLREQASEPGRRLIVTDLNLPGLSGHELIAEVRGDDRLRSSVIFVLSSSDLPEDIAKAYDSHVAGYIVKDAAGDRLQAGIAMLDSYLKAVTLR